MAKRFFPTQKKDKSRENINRFNDVINSSQNDFNLNLEKPYRFNDSECDKVFDTWLERFNDEWVNQVANVNAGNSLNQYNEFNLSRLSYAECAFLASDSIINNAINKYCNEILRRGGDIIIDIEDKDRQVKIKAYIEDRLKELDFFQVLREAISGSLIYGGSLIFIDINTEDLNKPLILKREILSLNKINGLRVIPPYLCGASQVNTFNPLNEDYMKPQQWFISGNAGTIHSSRFFELSIFDAPILLKPLYNFLGISLCQFMRSYVGDADVARKSLSDMLLRFKSEIIKSDLIKINPNEALGRAKAINKQKNNNSLILLTKEEEYIQSITPLVGLDKLISQIQENVAVSARIPAVKLLGLTPSGFNATGDFDLKSYYDEIMSLQNSKIKPIIDKVLRMLALEYGEDIYPSYEFELITTINKVDDATIKNLEADFISKNIADGVITSEQAFNYLKSNNLIDKSLDYDDTGEDDLEFNENGKDLDSNGENFKQE